MPVQFQANESISLINAAGQQYYKSLPSIFVDTLDGGEGPSPGLVICDTAGTIISLSQLTNPAHCWIGNQDPTNFVTIGIYNPSAFVQVMLLDDLIASLSCSNPNPYPGASVCVPSAEFFPIEEILPNQYHRVRLSRYLGQILSDAGSGTGSTGPGVSLMIRANTAACAVVIEAFNA